MRNGRTMEELEGLVWWWRFVFFFSLARAAGRLGWLGLGGGGKDRAGHQEWRNGNRNGNSQFRPVNAVQ